MSEQLTKFIRDLTQVADTPSERGAVFALARGLQESGDAPLISDVIERMQALKVNPFVHLVEEGGITTGELETADHVLTALNGGLPKMKMRPKAKTKRGSGGSNAAKRSAELISGYVVPKGVPYPEVPRRTGADIIRDWVYGLSSNATVLTKSVEKKLDIPSGSASSIMIQLCKDGIVRRLKGQGKRRSKGRGKYKKLAQANRVITRMWNRRRKTWEQLQAKAARANVISASGDE